MVENRKNKIKGRRHELEIEEIKYHIGKYV